MEIFIAEEPGRMNVCPAVDANVIDSMESLVGRGGKVSTYQIIMLNTYPFNRKMAIKHRIFA